MANPPSTLASPRGVAAALFSFQGLWPKWKSVAFTGSMTKTVTDTMFDNSGNFDPFNGSYSVTAGYSITVPRYALPAGAYWKPDVNSQGGESQGFGGGALFTHAGSVSDAAGHYYTGVGAMGSVVEGWMGWGIEWMMEPPLVPPEPVPANPGVLMRGLDAKLIKVIPSIAALGALAPASDLPSQSWDTENQSLVSSSSGSDPIIVNLEDLAREYTFHTNSYSLLTYHPGPDNPATGYYPTRGAFETVTTSIMTATFEAY